ncbi:MAG: hypothetical protein CVV11_19010 [Gammaproteobacteria bacterium HGW-Gammaproteobacteria-15]|nr:MAG: hypothetical protein CVV11_19010 [Gammaproteobacteria bacterium HGW-Gammaproteobacteria-15]
MQQANNLIDLVIVVALIATGFLIACFVNEPSFAIVGDGIQIALLLVAIKALGTWRQQFQHQRLWERKKIELEQVLKTQNLVETLVGAKGSVAVYYCNLSPRPDNYQHNSSDIKKLTQILNNISANSELLVEALKLINVRCSYTQYIKDFEMMHFYSNDELYLLAQGSSNSLFRQSDRINHQEGVKISNNQQSFFDLLTLYTEQFELKKAVAIHYQRVEKIIDQLEGQNTKQQDY